METWLALLRGVNVGGHNKVPMAALRESLSRRGLRDVATYIASGNILFDADDAPAALATRISAAIREDFGHDVPTLVRPAADLDRVAAANPFPAEAAADPKRVVVTFLDGVGDRAGFAAALADYAGPERAHLADSEIYVHFPAGQGRSRFPMGTLERRVGVHATSRNWNTVVKLSALLAKRGA